MSLLGSIGRQTAALPLGRYEILGGQLTAIDDNVTSYIKNGYNANDTIFSVINLILEKIKMAPWAIYTVVDESSLKQLHAIQSKKNLSGEDVRKISELHKKALVRVDKPGRWGDLLRYPNAYESFQEFVSYACGYKMLTGNLFIWADILEAGAEKGFPQRLVVMPTQDMMIKATRSFPAEVTGYQMTVDSMVDYSTEEVLHIKYPNYTSWNTPLTQLWGMAPLKSAVMLTSSSNASDKAAAAKYQNGGLQHIIFIDEPNIPSDARKAGMGVMNEMKKNLIREGTGPDNAGKIATASHKLGSIDLGLSPADLQIIEAQKWHLRRYCNIFGGVPSQLLNDPDNKVYNNMKEGEVALTTRGAMPHLTSFRDCLNRKAHDNWKLPPGQLIDFDATVYTELQEDVAQMMLWVTPLAKLTGLSPNRILDLMGLELQSDDYYNQPRVYPDMGETLAESQMSAVDNVLNSNDGEAGIQP